MYQLKMNAQYFLGFKSDHFFALLTLFVKIIVVLIVFIMLQIVGVDVNNLVGFLVGVRAVG